VSDKHPIVFINTSYPPVVAELEEKFTVYNHRDAKDQAALLAQAAGHARAVYTNGSSWIPALLDSLPKLELIACSSTGYDEFDLDLLKRRGIRLTHSPDLTSTDVADLAMALMLAAARRVTWGERYLRCGDWVAKGRPPLTRRVSGKTIGIIGLGAIGRKVAKRAIGFDMTISYQGPSKKDDVPYRYYADLVEMARDVDFVVVACIGGPSTVGIVTAEVLDALGSDGVLVNVARGSCVDGDALITALKNNTIGAAGLDCHAVEPASPDLYDSLDNVALTPHMGSATPESRRKMSDMAIDNLLAHFAGKPLLTPVPETPG
jgi:hydroxypyruvate reductase